MPDIVTVTAGTTGTPGSTGSVAGDLQTYFAAKLLKVAERRTVLKQLGEKVPLPPASSKTIAFVRAEKFSVSSTPTQLDEAVTPDAVGMSYSQITAVVEQ